MERNLTTGSVFKNIVFFSLPYLLSYFLQTLYGMADLFIIGQFEGDSQHYCCLHRLSGHAYAHRHDRQAWPWAPPSALVSRWAPTTKSGRLSISATRSRLFLALSVVLTVVLVLLVHPIVNIMSTPTEAVSGTVAYLTICFIGIPFITAYNIISSIFRGLGDSKSPMYFIAVACVANIGLDYLFIGRNAFRGCWRCAGYYFGADSQRRDCAVGHWETENRDCHARRLISNPKAPVLGNLLKIGVPIAVQDGLIQVAFHPYHHHRQPPWPHRCCRGRHCREDHRLCVSWCHLPCLLPFLP